MALKYSVLMLVYHGEKPDNFSQAIMSVLNQTYLTDDFVIVCDGKLTDELEKVIESIPNQYKDIVNVIRLPENVGIGRATNAGLEKCKNDLVAKLDSDDIAVPTRFELQCKRFEENENLSVLGGYIEEFGLDPDKPFAIREVPLGNDDIHEFARRRQPFNNTTVMYRKSDVAKAGGYRALRRSEDYDLYIRLLHSGAYAENLRDVLVKTRVDQSARVRRASWVTFKGCVQSRWRAFRIGYSSFWDFTVCCMGEAFICICPAKVQQYVYMKLFRKKYNHSEGNTEVQNQREKDIIDV